LVREAFCPVACGPHAPSRPSYIWRFLRRNPVDGDGHVDCDQGTATSCEDGSTTMKGRFGIRQALASSAIFAVMLMALASVDAGVRDRFSELLSPQGVGSWGDRASYLGGAFVTAAKYQSIENAPLVVFATAGALLFLFMLKT
jgi:hypothetical protein